MASSCAVYGNCERLPIAETETPEPLSPYAVTKLAAECLGQLYSRLYEVEAVTLRFFNVYGPRQDPASPYAAVVPRFAATLLAGGQPTIYGDGLQTRDLVYVGDIVQSLWAAATAPRAAGAVLNVGSGTQVSVLDLAREIGILLGRPVRPIYAPARPGEVRHSCADSWRLYELTGYRPATSLRDGLAATVRALACSKPAGHR
jgi:nucleoside-diphosphate-sugar epimerase